MKTKQTTGQYIKKIADDIKRQGFTAGFIAQQVLLAVYEYDEVYHSVQIDHKYPEFTKTQTYKEMARLTAKYQTQV